MSLLPRAEDWLRELESATSAVRQWTQVFLPLPPVGTCAPEQVHLVAWVLARQRSRIARVADLRIADWSRR
eukprot:13591464-Alexandrium_andersonii.AAC.1